MVARRGALGQHDAKLAEVSGKVVVVGVDVASSWHYVQPIEGASGRSLEKAFRIGNDWSGFDLLDRKLEALAKARRAGRGDVIVGIEPTGVYGQPLAYFLEQMGYHVVYVNPFAVKQTKELMDNTPTKSDPKDALVIADLVRNGRYLGIHLPKGVYADLRSLSDSHRERRKDRNRFVNRMRTALARYFPEFTKVMRTVDSDCSLWVLSHAPTPADVLAMDEEELARAMGSMYRRPRIERQRARRLREAARTSIGIPACDEARAYLMDLADQLSVASRRLKDCEKRMAQVLDKAGPTAKLILSIPGVGPVVAVHLLGRLGDLRQYEHPRQVVKMAGMNLTHNSSGHRDGKRHLSKRGSALLRTTVYQAALSVVHHDPAMQAIYRELRTKTKDPLTGTAALCAIGIRLLKVMWGMSRHGAAYDGRLVLAHRRHVQVA
ncbi:MAG: IS110 family transposase [Firmicutes bacterium]|nr:IS110 family transposase [Bacillota bacterium]